MQADEGKLHLTHEQVHVIARIPHGRDPLLVARHVVAVGSEQQLRWVVRGVEVGRADWTCAVEASEVGLGRAEVADLGGVGAMTERGSGRQ